MGRTEGRSADDTKSLILAAASRAVLERGLSATLDDIAAEAGVSKGGVVYHFRSKQQLLVALGTQLIVSFRDEVTALLDDADAGPGRLARAYIAAALADSHDVNTMRDNVALAAHLMVEEALHPIAQADAERWRREMAEDGLPDMVVQLVVSCTDGVNSAPLWGSALTGRDVTELRALLEALTRAPAGASDILAAATGRDPGTT